MEVPVSPVLQRYESPPDAVSITESPGQSAALPLSEIVATGSGNVLMVIVSLLLPQELLAVTAYTPAVVTVVESLVSPFDHVKLPAPVTQSRSVLPLHTLVALLWMPAAGKAFTVIVCTAVCDPQLLVAVSV